jgi:hypothetical protein
MRVTSVILEEIVVCRLTKTNPKYLPLNFASFVSPSCPSFSFDCAIVGATKVTKETQRTRSMRSNGRELIQLNFRHPGSGLLTTQPLLQRFFVGMFVVIFMLS